MDQRAKHAENFTPSFDSSDPDVSLQSNKQSFSSNLKNKKAEIPHCVTEGDELYESSQNKDFK